jgi:hypothetical protein
MQPLFSVRCSCRRGAPKRSQSRPPLPPLCSPAVSCRGTIRRKTVRIPALNTVTGAGPFRPDVAAGAVGSNAFSSSSPRHRVRPVPGRAGMRGYRAQQKARSVTLFTVDPRAGTTVLCHAASPSFRILQIIRRPGTASARGGGLRYLSVASDPSPYGASPPTLIRDDGTVTRGADHEPGRAAPPDR